jgi:UDP-N-acetylmuramate dehydrogenase
MMRLTADDRKWLSDAAGGSIYYGEPMARHTSFRVGGPAEAFVTPATVSDLSVLISGLNDREIPYRILGGGTNLIVRDSGIPGVVIRLQQCCRGITVESSNSAQTALTAMSGENLQKLCVFAMRRGFQGLNFALGIPGTVGGAIRMNAGTALGWMSDVLESLIVLDPSGRMNTIPKADLRVAYRSMVFPDTCNAPENVIISGRFVLKSGDVDAVKSEARKILQQRRRRQPTTLPSAGCIFKNPSTGKTAGELIDMAGLKGYKVGGAEISLKHANFIVNTGRATASDILMIMAQIRRIVYEKFQISLEPEVIIEGE